jgi:hypothetical protein
VDHLVTPGHTTRTATGRFLARTWRSVPVGLAISVATFWLLIAGAVAALLPAVAASTPGGAFVAVPGLAAHINQPGMPSWPIPVDRGAYDEADRGFRESDDDAIEHAFAASEWIQVSDGQAVRIVEVDGEAHHVELLEGRNVGRQGWLKTRHLRA